MNLFTNSAVNIPLLRKRAFNFRWAEVEEGVIPLTAADPDFPVANEIIDSIVQYLQGGYLSYTPKLGFPEFRKAAARDLCERKGEYANENLILPIDSAARGMYVIAQSVLSPGDEAIVFDPVDYLFKNSVLSAGGVPVYYPTRIKNGKIDFSDLEKYITSRTKMLCLCNPHNPLGMVYPAEDLDYILYVCQKYDLWIMNDEIWSDIIFGENPFISINTFGPKRNRKTLSVYGFSKAYGVAGLRVGFVYCMDQEVFQRLVEVSGVLTTAGGVSSLSQIGAMACIEKAQYWTKAFIKHLKDNRDYAYQRLKNMPDIFTLCPEATYLFWINVSKLGMDSSAFCDFMTEHVKLALVPGSEKMFGPGAEGYVRLCFATSHEILEEGLDRLERGLALIREDRNRD